jgi:hypothetical protein
VAAIIQTIPNLFVAALGVCVALYQVLLAIGVTVLVFVTLRGVGLLRRCLGHSQREENGSCS